MTRTSLSGVVALIALMSSAALGHDHWINNGKYMDATTGTHCCNEHDCLPLSEESIKSFRALDHGGVEVDGITFKKSQLHNSEDGKWYRCASRCVFRPVEG